MKLRVSLVVLGFTAIFFVFSNNSSTNLNDFKKSELHFDNSLYYAPGGVEPFKINLEESESNYYAPGGVEPFKINLEESESNYYAPGGVEPFKINLEESESNYYAPGGIEPKYLDSLIIKHSIT